MNSFASFNVWSGQRTDSVTKCESPALLSRIANFAEDGVLALNYNSLSFLVEAVLGISVALHNEGKPAQLRSRVHDIFLLKSYVLSHAHHERRSVVWLCRTCDPAAHRDPPVQPTTW